MSSISPLSSFPVLPSFLPVESSISHSPQLQTPKLLYRNINFESVILSIYKQNNDMFCPSSPIAPSDGLEALLQAACNKAEYNEKLLDQKDIVETVAESDTNRVFLKKVVHSETSESEIISFYLDDSGDAKIPATLSLDAMPCLNNNWLDDCITKNAKLKLIRILKGKVLVPKQC